MIKQKIIFHFFLVLLVVIDQAQHEDARCDAMQCKMSLQ